MYLGFSCSAFLEGRDRLAGILIVVKGMHSKSCTSCYCYYTTGKTRLSNGTDGINGCQQANGPGRCLLSSQQISNHAAPRVASPNLLHAAGTISSQSTIAAIHKSACLGGQSLAASTPRPACRGGRMMPEQPAKQNPAKKKQKPKHVPKPALDKNGMGNKSSPDQKSPPLPASASISSTVTTNAKPKTDENVPSAALPRIVIKIHQGKIVNPLTISSVTVKKQEPTRQLHGDMPNSVENKSFATGAQPNEKSDRLKARSILKLAKATDSNKSHTKIGSRSSSSKVLVDKNASISYLEQNNGSFDKLSLDCCMKLYGQLADPRHASQPPSRSSSSSAKSSNSSTMTKSCHKSLAVPARHASETKKRSVDQVKQAFPVCEPLPKIPAVGSGGTGSVKFSTSHPPDCSVQLNRLKSINASTKSTIRQSSQDNFSVLKSTNVKEKSSNGRDPRLSSNVYDFAGCVEDSAATCSQAAHNDAIAVQQQADIPTATEIVPGSSIPISKSQRTFSKKSHSPMDSNYNSHASVSPVKSRVTEITDHLNFAEKSLPGPISSVFNCSVKSKYAASAAVKKSDQSLSVSDLTPTQSAGCDIMDTGDNFYSGFDLPAPAVDCIKDKNSVDIRHTKKWTCGPTKSQESNMECSENSTSADGKQRRSSDSASSNDISHPVTGKKSRVSHTDDETANSACSAPSQATANNADPAAPQSTTVLEPTPDSERPSSVVRQTSPSCSQTSESSSSPLRLRIRRLPPDVSPVQEIYNVIEHDASSISTPSILCGMFFSITVQL